MAERHPNYESIVKSIQRNLVDFGYADLDYDTVLASYDKAINNEESVGIIDMMTRSQLKANGLLPTES